MMLDTFEDQRQRFVAFPDQFGNTVAINGDQLIVLEFPTAWAEQADRIWKKEVAREVRAERKAQTAPPRARRRSKRDRSP
jgi:hypothetical protein